MASFLSTRAKKRAGHHSVSCSLFGHAYARSAPGAAQESKVWEPNETGVNPAWQKSKNEPLSVLLGNF